MPARRLLVLATHNAGKLREIRAVLAGVPVQVLSLSDVKVADEVAETGATFAENACQKARQYSVATGEWALADDSGLAVDALDGQPGVRSARYAVADCPPDAERSGIDRANNAKLLAELAEVPDDERTARFICHLALADGEEILLTTRGTVEGRITREPCGENGFGYDPVFFVTETQCTAAQLSPEAKNAVSHRGRALRELAEGLKKLLKDR